MASSRLVGLIPIFLIFLESVWAGIIDISSSDVICQTTVSTTYVLPNGHSTTQNVQYWVIKDTADALYGDIWTPNNGAAMYMAAQPQSGSSWQVVDYTCSDAAILYHDIPYYARRYLYGITDATNYVLEYWLNGSFACSSSSLSCDESFGCVYDGTYTGATYYLFAEDEKRFLTAKTNVYNIAGTLTEGQQVTVSWPIYTVRDIHVSLKWKYSTDATWNVAISNQPVSAGTATTLSYSIDLGRNEQGTLELRAEVTLDDTTDGACNDYFTSTRSYTITDTQPSVSITAPTEVTTTSVTVTILYTSVDPVSKYEIYVDGSLYDSASGVPNSSTFDYTITGLTDGQHTIDVKVYEDPAQSDGDVATASTTVNVNSSATGDGWLDG
ncbi:TPA: hypothetical protein EYP13_04330 [Candidatus Micrarchaeota archaeon]|nr:hypothetical protein [Candidatus Micrarchaeota archaeon]